MRGYGPDLNPLSTGTPRPAAAAGVTAEASDVVVHDPVKVPVQFSRVSRLVPVYGPLENAVDPAVGQVLETPVDAFPSSQAVDQAVVLGKGEIAVDDAEKPVLFFGELPSSSSRRFRM